MATTKEKPMPKMAKESAPKAAPGSTAKKKAPASKSMSTTNHEDIKAWVDKRGGTPATVKGADSPGILRIDFPGYSGKDTLEAISWDDFFAKFDESNLMFLYQEKTAKGAESRFNKFVSNE